MCGNNNYVLSTKRIFLTRFLINFNTLYVFIFKGEAKGKISKDMEANGILIKAVCLPFISILSAIGNPSVDYFSLDIEGVELDVLKTIPWDKVDIKVSYKQMNLKMVSNTYYC